MSTTAARTQPLTRRQRRAINRARVREHRDRKNNDAVRLTIMVRPQHIEACPMSALGHKRTFAPQNVMSALPPTTTAKADFRTRSCLLYPRKRTCAVH